MEYLICIFLAPSLDELYKVGLWPKKSRFSGGCTNGDYKLMLVPYFRRPATMDMEYTNLGLQQELIKFHVSIWVP